MHKMRKVALSVLVATNAALSMAVAAAPAEAHNAATYYSSASYLSNATETYYINSYQPLSGGYGVPSQARDAITQSLATWSDLDGGNGPEFNYAGLQNSPILEYDCATQLGNSKIYWKAPDPVLGQYPLARTEICIYGPSGYIRSFAFYFDPTPAGASGGWEVDPTAAVNSNEWDLKSIATHESGHATGFDGHFGDPFADPACPSPRTSATQTMCVGNAGILGTSWLRTLESHDVDTLASWY